MQGLFTHQIFTKTTGFFRRESTMFENKVIEKVFPSSYPLALNPQCCEEIEDTPCCVPTT